MSFNESLQFGCPAPLYNAAAFPALGGYLDGRVCTPPLDAQGLICCLPCPVTQWIYEDDSYNTMLTGTAWVAVVSMSLLTYLLISYAVLPIKYTRSHYLNTCLIVTVILENLGFVVPLGAGRKECVNPITPSDMNTSLSCAFSGTFILIGGLTSCTWVFLRALSMHLQICWDITPGRRFFYWTQLAGWAGPAAVFTSAIVVTGVSSRFGPGACHINHHHSIPDFWGWLLGLAGVSICVQFGTMFYCFHVYLRNLFSDEPEETQMTGATPTPTYTSSQRAATARAIYIRLKRVLWLQWRGLALVTLMLIDVTFFAVVFVSLDRATTPGPAAEKLATPFVLCLMSNPHSPEKCYGLGQKWLLNKNTIYAVFVMLPFIGIILFMLLFRFSFLVGWKEFIMSKFSRSQEFVSLDATQHAQRQAWQQQDAKGAMFEMQEPKKEYGSNDAEHSAGSPTMSTTNTSPIEQTNPAGYYIHGNNQPTEVSQHQYYQQYHQPPQFRQAISSTTGSDLYSNAGHFPPPNAPYAASSPTVSSYSGSHVPRPHSPYGTTYPAVSPYGEHLHRTYSNGHASGTATPSEHSFAPPRSQNSRPTATYGGEHAVYR